MLLAKMCKQYLTIHMCAVIIHQLLLFEVLSMSDTIQIWVLAVNVSKGFVVTYSVGTLVGYH